MRVNKRHIRAFAFIGAVAILFRSLSQSLDPSSLQTIAPTVDSITDGDATSGSSFRMNKRQHETYPGLDQTKKKQVETSGKLVRDWMRTTLPTGFFSCRLWGVVTTIFAPTKAVRKFASAAASANSETCLLVIGDKANNSSVYDFAVGENGDTPVAFLDADTQESLAKVSPFVAFLPWNHFGRKNVGYLMALLGGAEQVFDFDDDNTVKNMTNLLLLASGLKQAHTLRVFSRETPHYTGVENPYPALGAPQTWPRGFPLEHVQASFDDHVLDVLSAPSESIGIVQMLADVAPDVDGVYRLTAASPDFNFSWAPSGGVHPLLVVPQGSLAPWNAQATLFAQATSLWGLLLPISVHGRVSDIWRSYIVGCLFQQVGLCVSFSAPANVVHERNSHQSLKDFNAEIPLYQQAGALTDFLRKRQSMFTSSRRFDERIIELWDVLYQYGILQKSDVQLVHLWLGTLKGGGYNFPILDQNANPILQHKNSKRIDKNTHASLEKFWFIVNQGVKPSACQKLDKILFVVKTGGPFAHRAHVMKSSWGRYAKHFLVLSDTEDPSVPAILPLADDWNEFSWLMKQSGAMRSCITLLHGMKLILMSEEIDYDWIAVGDDDTFWQTNRLAASLSRFDAANPAIFRMPLGQDVDFTVGYSTMGGKVSKRVPCGSTAAGLVLSRGFMELMKRSLSFSNAAIRNFCVEGNGGDDTTLNYLGVFLGVLPQPLAGLTYDHPRLTPPTPEQITFHGRLNPRYSQFSLGDFTEFLPAYYNETDEICRT